MRELVRVLKSSGNALNETSRYDSKTEGVV